MGVYLWTDNGEVTETFRWSDSGSQLYKPGYKIKEITIQYTAYYSGSTSTWTDANWGLYDNVTPLDYRIIFRLGGEWHYSGYVDTGYGMVGGWKNDSGVRSDTQIKRFASNATNNRGGSCIVTFNVNGGHVKVGTTFGTWIQDEDYTHDSAKQTRTQTIFESQNVTIANNNNATISNDLMTVTREPI